MRSYCCRWEREPQKAESILLPQQERNWEKVLPLPASLLSSLPPCSGGRACSLRPYIPIFPLGVSAKA